MKVFLTPKQMIKGGERKRSLPFKEKEEGLQARRRGKRQLAVLSSPLPGKNNAAELLFASRKRSAWGFTLVRVLNAGSYSSLHYVAIEGKVQQLEVRYVCNACEGALLELSKKLSSGGLFVELEPVSEEEYRRLERIGRRQLQAILGSRKRKEESREQPAG